MRNIFKSMLCIFLAAASACSMVACGGGDAGQTDNSSGGLLEGGANGTEKTNYERIYNERHSFKFSDTDSYLLRNGTTDYKVVVPEVSSLENNVAKNELVNIFQEATGVTLEVIGDMGLEHNAENHYISLGRTALFETSGLSSQVDANKLKRDGARILTKDQTIFFVGGTSDYGVLYGVYDFLYLHFGFDVYFKDNYALQTGVRDLHLAEYDVTDIPDIEYRSRSSGAQSDTSSDYDVQMFSYRTRTRDYYWSMLMPINGHTEHNSISGFFPTEKYGQYSDFYGGQQLCYTAHGNAESYALMVKIAAETIEEALMSHTPEQYPDMNAVQIGCEDNDNMCQCSACLKVQAKYNNSIAATIILFLKDVGKQVNAWMDLEENAAYKRENLQYMFFAYWGTEHAPVNYNEETGTYDPPADDAILPEEGLNIVPYIGIKALDHGKPMYSDANRAAYLDFAAWMSMYPNSWVWSYGGAYNDYFCFVDNLAFYSEAFPFMVEKQARFSNIQQHNHQTGSDTGFFNLDAYVNGKLQWNSALNVNELIDVYFDGMYLNAAAEMKGYYNLCKLWFADALRDEQVWSNIMTGNSKYFKLGTINGMLAQLDKAYEAIKVYEPDAALYGKVKSNIDAEWLFPAMTAVSASFSGNYTTLEMNEMKANFKDICGRLGLTAYGEKQDLSGFLNSL